MNLLGKGGRELKGRQCCWCFCLTSIWAMLLVKFCFYWKSISCFWSCVERKSFIWNHDVSIPFDHPQIAGKSGQNGNLACLGISLIGHRASYSVFMDLKGEKLAVLSSEGETTPFLMDTTLCLNLIKVAWTCCKRILQNDFLSLRALTRFYSQELKDHNKEHALELSRSTQHQLYQVNNAWATSNQTFTGSSVRISYSAAMKARSRGLGSCPSV